MSTFEKARLDVGELGEEEYVRRRKVGRGIIESFGLAEVTDGGMPVKVRVAAIGRRMMTAFARDRGYMEEVDGIPYVGTKVSIALLDRSADLETPKVEDIRAVMVADQDAMRSRMPDSDPVVLGTDQEGLIATMEDALLSRVFPER